MALTCLSPLSRPVVASFPHDLVRGLVFGRFQLSALRVVHEKRKKKGLNIYVSEFVTNTVKFFEGLNRQAPEDTGEYDEDRR